MLKNEAENKIDTISNFNNSNSTLQENKVSIGGFITSVITSLRVGSFGFAIVLSLIIITKLLAFSIGSKELFMLNLNDILISSWGFIILSFSKFISYQKK
ncbi:MAG: hypothetical protein V3V16_05640 [Melioribacteraceae bacterium]